MRAALFMCLVAAAAAASTPALAQTDQRVAEALDDFRPRGQTPSVFVPQGCRPMFENDGRTDTAVLIVCPDEALFDRLRFNTHKFSGELAGTEGGQPVYRITRKES